MLAEHTNTKIFKQTKSETFAGNLRVTRFGGEAVGVAEPTCRRPCCRRRYFDPHSLRGERRSALMPIEWIRQFRSTLPVRGATYRVFRPWLSSAFQSTLPVRGATICKVRFCINSALFQSTLPVRGATIAHVLTPFGKQFQSTLPVRGATAIQTMLYGSPIFQSTLPARGATGETGGS